MSLPLAVSHFRTLHRKQMMGDTMDEVMEGEDDEAEEAAILSQIYDEIGIDVSQLAPDAPRMAPAGPKREAAAAEPAPVAIGAGGGGSDSAVSDLEERLNNLRRNG